MCVKGIFSECEITFSWHKIEYIQSVRVCKWTLSCANTEIQWGLSTLAYIFKLESHMILNIRPLCWWKLTCISTKQAHIIIVTFMFLKIVILDSISEKAKITGLMWFGITDTKTPGQKQFLVRFQPGNRKIVLFHSDFYYESKSVLKSFRKMDFYANLTCKNQVFSKLFVFY